MLQSHLHQLKKDIYAVIKQEILAVIFECQRFHQYIYEKKVHIENYHKPLESIMNKAM